MVKTSRIFILLLLWLFSSSSLLYASSRVALVIGNGTYKSGALANPVNDATDVGNVLEKLGFDVLTLHNADKRVFFDTVNKFSKKLHNAEIGLFFFAGHGIQIEGRNYLIPVNTKIISQADVEYEAIPVGRVLAKMEEEQCKIKIVILDACRNNPFRSLFRSNKQGLAKMDAPSGTLIAYATSPGSVAYDGDGRNGLFTKHLLRALQTPGLSIQELLNQAGLGVIRETNNGQVPWLNSSPIEPVVLSPGSTPPKTDSPFFAGAKAYQARDYREAFTIWKDLADHGHPEAMFRLADLYEWGNGTDRDVRAALKYYRNAALSGHGDAQFAYANKLDGGQGTRKKRRTAYFWYYAATNSKSASQKSKYHADLMIRVGENVSNYKLSKKEIHLLEILKSKENDPVNFKYDLSLFSDY